MHPVLTAGLIMLGFVGGVGFIAVVVAAFLIILCVIGGVGLIAFAVTAFYACKHPRRAPAVTKREGGGHEMC